MKDVFKKSRGRCLHTECSTLQMECPEFMVTGENLYKCAYCEHLARFHELISNTESSGVKEIDSNMNRSTTQVSKEVPKKDNLDSSDATKIDININNLYNPTDTVPVSKKLPIDDNLEVYKTPKKSCMEESCEKSRELLKNPAKTPKKSCMEESFEKSREVLNNSDKKENLAFTHTYNILSDKNSLSKMSYLPISFSDITLSVLNAEAMSPSILRRGRNQLVREIHNYLDEEELIQGSCSNSNRKEYRAMADQLVAMFPEFQWNGENSLGKNSHKCNGLISCLSARRRAARFSKRKSVKAVDLSPAEDSLENFEKRNISPGKTNSEQIVLQNIKMEVHNIEEELIIEIVKKETGEDNLKEEIIFKQFGLQNNKINEDKGIKFKNANSENSNDEYEDDFNFETKDDMLDNSSKNEAGGPYLDRADKISSKKSTIEQLSYVPSSFSNIALSVLNAEALSSFTLRRGRNQLVREIREYLDDNGLIESTCGDSGKFRKEYQLLGDQLVALFPKFEWMEDHDLRNRRHLCQALLTCLSSRRRAARCLKNKQQKR